MLIIDNSDLDDVFINFEVENWMNEPKDVAIELISTTLNPTCPKPAPTPNA